MKNPSHYEDPPEDPPEVTPEEEQENYADYMYQKQKDERAERENLHWDTPTNHPYADRDCDYWRQLK